MRVTVLPELTAESVETAERLGRLSAEEGLDPAEAEYLLTSGLTAVQRVTRLWRIIRDRIGTGLTGPKARELLLGLLVVVDKNLALAVTLKEPARIVREELGPESEVAPGLAEVEDQLREIHAQAIDLLKIVDAPARWPGETRLKEARDQMRAGAG